MNLVNKYNNQQAIRIKRLISVDRNDKPCPIGQAMNFNVCGEDEIPACYGVYRDTKLHAVYKDFDSAMTLALAYSEANYLFV